MSVPVMIFAAGFGTRMGPLTQDRPKPLIPVAGRALIDHTLDLARGVKPARIVVNTHYLAPMMAAHLRGSGVLIANEHPAILDTGGGLRAAGPMLASQTVITMNSDAIWSGPNPAQLALSQWEPDRMDALLVCVPLERARGRKGAGDFGIDGSGRVSRDGEFVYGGVQILKTDGLSGIAEESFSLNVLWDKMLAQGRLFAAAYPGHWCDVGHPDGIKVAEDLIRNRDV